MIFSTPHRRAWIHLSSIILTLLSAATLSFAQPLSVTASADTVICQGGSATITATASFGTPPYTYGWSPTTGLSCPTCSNTTASPTATTTYVIQVTDGALTTKTDTVIVTVTYASFLVSAACQGGTTNFTDMSTGSPVSWNWNFGDGNTSTLQHPSNTYTATGTYTVTLSATTASCTESTSQVIAVNANPAASATSVSVSCFGGMDGSASVTPSGGTGPYSYYWSNGLTTQTIVNLIAGSYTITVTDFNGCTAADDTIVAEPPVLVADAGTNQTLCSGTSAVIGGTPAATGGTGSYTYSWIPATGLSSSTIANPIASPVSTTSYTLIVTDANNCNDSSLAVTVTVNSSPAATISSQVNVACTGGINGSATASVTGGASPYTYFWNPSGATAATATGLAAGNHDVTVYDLNGCTSSATATITEPSVLSVATSQTNVSCNGGNNGSATATVSGGTTPYTYSWSTGGFTATESVLAAGTYSVLVTDNNGCTSGATVTITQPATALSATTSVTNASCNGASDGSATAIVTGGTSPYSYSWNSSPAQTTQTATGLPSNPYTVVVTDNNGCVTNANASINQPTVLSANIISSTNVSCNGGNNGSAGASASGGTSPYTYLWNPSGQNSSVATGLTAGIYTVSVTDNNGCPASAVVTLTEPSALIVSVSSQTNVTCNGGMDGSATGSASAGVFPYTYSWSPAGGTGVSATGLAAGNYTIAVTDANGCVSSATTAITEPPAIVVTLTSTSVSCSGGNDGSMSTTVSGGAAPYTYAWSNGATTQNIINVPCNLYSVTVTDASGCTATASAVVNQPIALTVTLAVTNTNCNNTCTGSATATPAGGISPYTYLWSPTGDITQTASGLCIGAAIAMVTDNNGCAVTDTISVGGPLPVPITATAAPTSCGVQNGTATADISGPGAVPPFYVLWNTGDTGLSISGLGAGIFRANVTDGNGCFSFADALVSNSNGPSVSVNTVTAVSCHGFSTGSINISVTGATPPYTFFWSNGATTEDISSLFYGPYEVSVTDAGGCTATQSIFVNEPVSLSLASSSISSSCAGASGSAMASVSGGTSPYTYLWTSGGTASTETGLGASAYGVTITDANGCTLSELIAVSDSGGPLAFVDTVAAADCGSSGYVLIIPQDSSSILSYIWTNGDSTQNLLNATPGNYGLVITDTSGCKSTLVVPVIPVLPELKPICLVTVDSLGLTNMVGWEKPISTIIAGFNIYRESSEDDVYQLIGYVPYNSLSIYIDSIADPDDRWAKYRISMVDICGSEGPLSPEHKTIHLAVQSNDAQAINIIWDDHVGYPFSYYHIYRKSNSTGPWVLIDSVLSTVTTYSDSSFTAGDTIYYHIDVSHPDGCTASIKNPNPLASNLNSSRSNIYKIIDTSLVSVSSGQENNSIILYPNPGSGVFTILSPEKKIGLVSIRNMLGEEIITVNPQHFREKEIRVDLRPLARGIYTLQLFLPDRVVNKKVIIE